MRKIIALTMLMLFCVSLTACKQIIKTEYIKQQIPELPKEPEMYPVAWAGVNGMYCVDAENAKNLLKNWELNKGNRQELRKILEQLKEEKK